MYEIIKGVINSKDYELKDILYKINKMYIESAITEEQKQNWTIMQELMQMQKIVMPVYKYRLITFMQN